MPPAVLQSTTRVPLFEKHCSNKKNVLQNTAVSVGSQGCTIKNNTRDSWFSLIGCQKNDFVKLDKPKCFSVETWIVEFFKSSRYGVNNRHIK